MAKRHVTPSLEPLTSNPFAALGGLRDDLHEGQRAPVGESPTHAVAARGPARAVVRYERAGRGGREATVIEQLGLSAEHADAWCREFKRVLGCGGGVEGEHLVLAGDQRARLPPLLEAKGVRRVTVS